MTRPAYIEAAIARAYQPGSILCVAFVAAFEDDVRFNKVGSSAEIDMAADRAGDVINGPELSRK